MRILVFLVVLALGAAVVVAVLRANQRRAEERKRAELEPVKKLAFEDITALGVELQDLDLELAGRELDTGAQADYQRALDAYEAAKTAGDRITRPDDIKNITEILDDGRYAMACVVARVEGRPLPTRRPPCFFDPRHGLSVADVTYAPPGGAPRQVPACALDAERVQRRRRARRPPGDGGLAAGAVLAGRTRLPSVRHGLLRGVRPDGLDVHGPDVRRLRRHRRGHRRDGRGHRRRDRRDVRRHRRHVRLRRAADFETSAGTRPGRAPPARSTRRAATRVEVGPLGDGIVGREHGVSTATTKLPRSRVMPVGRATTHQCRCSRPSP